MMEQPRHVDLLTVHTVKGNQIYTNCLYFLDDIGLHVTLPECRCSVRYPYGTLMTDKFTAHSSDAIARLRNMRRN